MVLSKEETLLVMKAKRRIRRFVKTGVKQARVRVIGTDNVTFQYIVKHTRAGGALESWYFKRNKLGHLRKIKSPV